MTGCRQDNRAAGLPVGLLVLVIITCAGLLGSARAVATVGSDGSTSSNPLAQSSLPGPAPAPGVRVVDPSSVLTAQQFQQLNADLDRLARLGTETIVFIRDAADTSTDEAYLAEDLRVGWSIESAAGARDGLVIVVSIDRADPAQSTVVTSSGMLTFPIRRLSEAGYDQLVQQVVLPEIQSGNVFKGVSDLIGLTLGTLIDTTGTLTERQVATIDGDIRRLNELGLPMLVYIRAADESATEDQAFADEILSIWSTEFEGQPQDQIVVLVTVDEETTSASTITYAAGKDAFPIRQLTAEGYQTILDDEALPPLQDGDVYLSLAYAVRKAINFAEYSPPSPAPLNDIQSWFQQPMNILAAIAVQAGLAFYVLIPAILERRLTLVPAPKSMTVYIIVTSILGVVVGMLGVMVHNRAAALAGLGVFLLATAVFPLVRAGLLKISEYTSSRRRAHRSAKEDVAHAR